MNRKRFLCFQFLFIFLIPAFTTELTGKYSSEDCYISFQEPNYTFYELDMMTGEQQYISGTYKTTTDDYNNKIVILENFKNENLSLRYFLFDEFLILYNNKNSPWFLGNIKTSRRLESIVSTKISATSYLTEGEKKYIPDNLSLWGHLDYVWAEGNKSSGIGEKLYIENKSFKNLYILPGFVSVTRPDLYKKNNRPKTIRITAGVYSKDYLLKDEPCFQTIKLEIPITEDLITLEIIDIYAGTHYNDTCITSILCQM